MVVADGDEPQKDFWRAHDLQSHRLRAFMLSNDAQFAAKVRGIICFYVDPPAHTIVLSVDEESQIQALDRTQPGPALELGRCGTMDPRLQAPRHHHAVRCARRDRRQGHRIGSDAVRRFVSFGFRQNPGGRRLCHSASRS